MSDQARLQAECERIDGKGYGAYKDLRGAYNLGSCRVSLDHIQSDPYAPPSKVRLEVGAARAGFPQELYANRVRRVALQDFVARCFAQAIRDATGRDRVEIDSCGQEILERTAVRIEEGTVEVRCAVGLPAKGRRILGRQAAFLFTELLPRLAEQAMLFARLDASALYAHVWAAEDQEELRRVVSERGYIGFVGNGARLARASGISDAPLTEAGAVSFVSPPELEIGVDVPHAGEVRGMAIPAGVTVIVGGGYHGKSTLLRALERGVYNHIPGDGREWVVSSPSAVKIRAEDGRAVTGVDISPFISALPNGQSTSRFTSSNASGSTSQAANIIEALEAGSRVLLVDEDTSATNFMIRDSRMQALVAKDQEPITPFIDRIRELYTSLGVSTVLVMGGSGDYLGEADTVLKLHTYRAGLVTEQAREITAQFPQQRCKETQAPLQPMVSRRIAPSCFSLGPRDKVRSKGKDHIGFGTTAIDLSFVEQLVDGSQTRTLAAVLRRLPEFLEPADGDLYAAVRALQETMADSGLETLVGGGRKHPGELAQVRVQDVLAAVSRYRRLSLAAAAKKGD
ncbi:MAG: ABC-ATPase domain-containing protein [Thermodesulfobacteriota bacterium]